MNRVIKTFILTLIFLMFALSLYPLGKSIDQTAPGNTNPIPELFYFPKTSFIKNIAFGYNNLLADIFWIRSIQYIGQHLMSDNVYPYLYHILDITTSLDPRFINAYNFGSFFLAIYANNEKEGIELAEKGIKNNPKNWQPTFELGFIYYLKKDYENAYRYFSLANTLPGMPDEYKTFAPYALGKFASPEQSIEMWKAIEKMSDNQFVREAARNNIAVLTQKKNVEMLNRAVQNFKDRFHRFPSSLSELVEKGIITGLPEPVGGMPYDYDPSTGRVTAQKPKFKE
ncbi:MAG: tetratricopeptide repeat protein [bacterium]